MSNFSVVMFDVDGVLLDSLPKHLKYCGTMSEEYRLGLSIPDVDGLRDKVIEGKKISPMEFFFREVGFSDDDADRANESYKANFNRNPQPKLFPDVHEMLDRLKAAHLALGIATSNVKSNLKSAMGSELHFFEDLVYTHENEASPSKVVAIKDTATRLQIDIEKVLYVGDQPADMSAAKEAGARFLGVTYGWGISKGANEFDTVDDVKGIADYVLVNGSSNNPAAGGGA